MDSLAAVNGANASEKSQQQPVLTEPPETLRRLLLMLVKTFYSLEQYVVFDYIMKKVILREDELRDVCKIDTKQLRNFLKSLKVDKFIKERLVLNEVDGRKVKYTYYFVNYKGALNVAKYKIDHIRQKLEVREKDSVNRAYYRCTNCKRQYHAMDMGKIFDPFTQEMRCWQCNHLVEQDESGGPSQATRSSMAKFNEQMTEIFSMLKQMDGVRFGREITEPAIQGPISTGDGGDTIDLDTRKVVNLGQRAFSAAGRTRSDLYGGEITVSIGDNVEKAPEAKPEIPWLLTSRQDDQPQQPSTSSVQSELLSYQQLIEMRYQSITEFGTEQTSNGQPESKRARREDIQLWIQEELSYSVNSDNG